MRFRIPRVPMLCLALAGTLIGGQAAQAPVKPVKPLKPVKVQPSPEAQGPRPVIVAFRVEDTQGALSWVVTVENQGTAPTQEGTSLVVYRGGDPGLNAGSMGIPVIPPAGSATVSTALNPDPKQGLYTLAVRFEGKDLHTKPSTLGIPTVTVGVTQVEQATGAAWTAEVRNTWSYSLKALKVQVLRRETPQSAWVRVTEETLELLGPGATRMVKGTGTTPRGEYKALVFLRRVPAEPWVELASSQPRGGR